MARTDTHSSADRSAAIAAAAKAEEKAWAKAEEEAAIASAAKADKEAAIALAKKAEEQAWAKAEKESAIAPAAKAALTQAKIRAWEKGYPAPASHTELMNLEKKLKDALSFDEQAAKKVEAKKARAREILKLEKELSASKQEVAQFSEDLMDLKAFVEADEAAMRVHTLSQTRLMSSRTDSHALSPRGGVAEAVREEQLVSAVRSKSRRSQENEEGMHVGRLVGRLWNIISKHK